jgi:hypothetical protein
MHRRMARNPTSVAPIRKYQRRTSDKQKHVAIEARENWLLYRGMTSVVPKNLEKESGL